MRVAKADFLYKEVNLLEELLWEVWDDHCVVFCKELIVRLGK